MKIAVEIDERELAEIPKLTGIEKKSPAVRQALRSYLREAAKRRFLRKVLQGKTDYTLTNDELEALATDDSD